MIKMAKLEIKVEFTDEQRKVLAELGPAEISRRIAAMSLSERCTQVFSWSDRYEIALLPGQAVALANLATAMQRSYPTQLVVREGAIYREDTHEEMARTIAQHEIWKREARKNG